MEHAFSDDCTKMNVRALFLGQRLNMKALEKSKQLGTSPFIIKVGENGYAVLFRYGIAVLFGVNMLEESSFLKDIKEFIIEPFETPETEETEIKLDKNKADGTEPEFIHVSQWNIERLQLVAEIIAPSLMLSHYESRMTEIFDRIEPITTNMQTGKIGGRQTRGLMRHIGLTLSIQRKMVGHVEIEEKPELLWDNPELERFYVRLEDEYELRERHTALRHKLDLIYRTAETMLGMLQERRTLHVEWYIVILILVEIIIMVGEKIL